MTWTKKVLDESDGFDFVDGCSLIDRHGTKGPQRHFIYRQIGRQIQKTLEGGELSAAHFRYSIL